MSIKNIARSTTNRERRERAEAELNLIPLIDIMSVMVAFLLVYSADVEVVQNSKGVAVPQSVAEELPKQSVVVMITTEQLFVQGELVANVEDDPRRQDAADRAAARGARAADADRRRRSRRRWTSPRARSRCWPTRPCRTTW